MVTHGVAVGLHNLEILATTQGKDTAPTGAIGIIQCLIQRGELGKVKSMATCISPWLR